MVNTTSPDTTGSTFEQLLEAAPDAIVGVGQEGRVVLVSSQTRRFSAIRGSSCSGS